MENIYSILYFIGLIFSGFGLGSLIINPIYWNKKFYNNNILKFIINSTFGLGFLSLIHFIFGCIHGFAKPLVFILIILIFTFSLYGIYVFILNIINFIKSKPEKLKKPNFIAITMLTIMIVGLGLCFINSLTPSISDDWDSLAYHLSTPKKFLENGGFYYINYSSHTNFPMLQEILYITPIFFNIPIAGKLIHFFFGIMSILLISYILSVHFIKDKDKYSTVWGAFMLFSMPIVLWLMTTAYIDVTFAFFGLSALYFALNYSNTKHNSDALLCGFACGFGASCKMLGFQYVLIFALWIILDNIFSDKKFNYKKFCLPTIILIISSIIICSCWYIKTTIFTGNPVYPFFYNIFGGKDWSQELADFYSSNQAIFGVGHNIRAFITTPIWMTIDPDSFYDVPGLSVGIVLLFTFPIMCLLYQVRKRKLLLMAISICLLYIIWFLLTHQSRYLIPLFFMSCVFIPAILSYIKKAYFIKYLIIIIFIIVSFIGLFQMYSLAFIRYPVVKGDISKEVYLTKYFKPYKANVYINENLPDESKIGLFGDTEGFYLNRNYIWCDYGHNSLLSHNYSTPEELILDLKKNNISHIIVPFGKNPPTIGEREFAQKTNKILYEAIDKGLFTTIFPENMASGQVFVFKLK